MNPQRNCATKPLNGITALSDSDKQTVKAKNRTDHRHHAIDAAVVAATDRALIQRISKMAGRDELDGAEEVARSVPPPWAEFRDDIAAHLRRIIVSHRADHGRIDPAARKSGRDSSSGQLHNDTAYGLTDDGTAVTRKPLMSLTPGNIAISSSGANIRDADLQRHLARVTRGLEGKDFEQALAKFASARKLPDHSDNPYFGLRRVRMEEALNVIPVESKTGRAYKGYKPDSNARYEIWKLPDGTLTHHVVSTFDAHKDAVSKPHPAAKRLHRFHKGDLLRLEQSKFGPVIATVEKFNVNGGIELVPHNEANASDRYRKSKEDLYIRLSATTLIKSGGRRVYVDEMGRVQDPGVPKGTIA